MNKIYVFNEYIDDSQIVVGSGIEAVLDTDGNFIYRLASGGIANKYIGIKTTNSAIYGLPTKLIIKFNKLPSSALISLYVNNTAIPPLIPTKSVPKSQINEDLILEVDMPITSANQFAGIQGLSVGDEINFIKLVYTYSIIDNNNIREIDIHNSVNRYSTLLPISTANVKIDSSVVGLFGDELSSLYIYNNQYLIGAYYVETMEKISDEEYEVKAVDSIGFLTKKNIGSFNSTTTSAQTESRIKEICKPFKSFFIESLENDTKLSFSLKDTRREQLKNALFAVHRFATTDGGDVILFNRQAVEKTIIDDDVYIGGSYEVGQNIKQVSIISHELVENENGNIQIAFVRYIDNQVNHSYINTGEANGIEYSVVNDTYVHNDNATQLCEDLFQDLYAHKDKYKTTIDWHGERLGFKLTINGEFGVQTGILVDYILRISQTSAVADITLEIEGE